MKHRPFLVAVIVVVLSVGVAIAQAGPGGGMGPGMGPGMRGGQGMQGPGARNYDPAAETTIKGTVEEVTDANSSGRWPGTHLQVKTEQGTYDVHVGPSSFVKANNFSFAKGDSVEITGAKATFNNQNVLIAREISKDGKTLALRDAQGIPKWSRRAQPNQ